MTSQLTSWKQQEAIRGAFPHLFTFRPWEIGTGKLILANLPEGVEHRTAKWLFRHHCYRRPYLDAIIAGQRRITFTGEDGSEITPEQIAHAKMLIARKDHHKAANARARTQGKKMTQHTIVDVEYLVGDQAGEYVPTYETKGAAGADLRALLLDGVVVIEPGERALIPTGLFFAIPEGFEMQVRSRSGLAHKAGIIVLNAPGTIDEDYRGEVKVNLFNAGDKPFIVDSGDRIAQAVFAPVVRARFFPRAALSETARGTGGHGSTGV